MSATASAAAGIDLILRDGGTLRPQPPRSDEADRVLAFFLQLSDRSLFLRFHGFRALDRTVVEPFLDPDWSTRGALAASLGEDDENRAIALGSYSRIGDSDAAEMAFAVSDDEQGRGIGTRLLEQLALAANRHGISRFVADVLATNTPALTVFRDAGFEVSRTREADDIELRLPIAPTSEYEGRVAERDHVAGVNSLRPFFRPESVAVLGALFGPLVAFGPGEAFAELIDDAGFRLAPLTDLDALELLTGGKAGRLVAGFRGAPSADLDALCDLVLRLGRLAEDLPEVCELDLNPVLASPDGCVAVECTYSHLRSVRPEPAQKLVSNRSDWRFRCNRSCWQPMVHPQPPTRRARQSISRVSSTSR